MRNRRSNLIDIGKSVLIVLLSCSAIVLIGQSPLYQGFEQMLGLGEKNMVTVSQQPGSDQHTSEIVIKPNQLMMQNYGVRHGVQFDQEAIDQLYDMKLGLRLREVLSSVEAIRQITEEQWREKLTQGAVWVYYEFPGTVPLLELSAWLSEVRVNPALSGSVRGLLLEEQGDGLILSYRNEEDGRFYTSELVRNRESRLAALMTNLEGNGASFAFELDEYALAMDSYTILVPGKRAFPVYSVKDPMKDLSSANWEALLKELSFNPKSMTYETPDALVVNEGQDSLRLMNNGTISYENSGMDVPKYFVEGDSLGSQVEDAKRILDIITAGHLGEGTSYLAGVSRQEDNKLLVTFGYALNGMPVQVVPFGYGAEFLFQGGAIERFEVRVRHYEKTELEMMLLPVRQAVAAFLASEQEDRRLVRSYIDPGEDRNLLVSWTAV